MHSSAPSELEASVALGDLGVDLTVMILSKLDARSLASANLACKFFQALGAATVPDLNLESLYPHQRTALRWMIQKEQDGPSPSHPFIREWHMGPDKIPIYINFVTGCISTDPPEPVQQMKGGLFCESHAEAAEPFFHFNDLCFLLMHQVMSQALGRQSPLSH